MDGPTCNAIDSDFVVPDGLVDAISSPSQLYVVGLDGDQGDLWRIGYLDTEDVDEFRKRLEESGPGAIRYPELFMSMLCDLERTRKRTIRQLGQLYTC